MRTKHWIMQGNRSCPKAGVFSVLRVFCALCSVLLGSSVLHAAATIPYSPIYPKSIHEKIANLLEEAESSNTSFPQATANQLRSAVELFGIIDTKLKINPNSISAELTQLKNITAYLSEHQKEHSPFQGDLEDIRLAIHRRIDLLHDTFRVLQSVNFSEPFPLNSDCGPLKKATLELKNHLDAIQDHSARLWTEYWELESLLTLLDQEESGKEKNPVANGPQQRNTAKNTAKNASEFRRRLGDFANRLLARFEGTFTQEQVRFLQRPIIVAWKNELEKWNADTVHPFTLLEAVERYESNRLFSESENLSDIATRLSVCKNAALKKLGRTALELYGRPNIKIYVSEALLNYLLPDRQPEYERFRDVIVGQPVEGKRRTDTTLKVVLKPDEEHLKMQLNVDGKIDAIGMSRVRSAEMQSETLAKFSGNIPLEWTEQGIVSSPLVVSVDHQTRLRAVKTGMDGVPIFSRLVREVVRNQYTSREPQINAETRWKIASQLKSRVNSETNPRFEDFNDVYRTRILTPMEHSGLFLEQKDSCTTKDWLLSSWRLISFCSLGSHTQEPPTAAGSFADLKFHESTLQTLVGSLELEGNTFSVAELKQKIADRIEKPDLFEEQGENDDVSITFAKRDPVLVRFFEGRVEISLAIAAMKVRRSVWRNFRFIVNYEPGFDETGTLCLQRNPSLSVIGKLDPKTQFSLRTIVSRLFPPNKKVPLVPAIFDNDPKWSELTPGVCRIENGWFALAIVAKSPSQESKSAGLSTFKK